ncbi:SAM-dependent methyltransferase [Novosphingobium kaempferiae]|uniref:SAM-dependent methyltransferase n=1 Tax=Novosphingobium kaempferiae TaxID=2896849 RepID=UPI001E3AED02|nr:SAM-dependent methyltransferase [Novosphingobium kaempferiae]
MNRPLTSLSPDYFERMFQGSQDPWNLESSAYEAAKYRATVAALETRRFARALEVGCARGVLTRQLAPHCDALLAIDVSGTALKAARERCADLRHVLFANMVFPKFAPATRFDLLILSEVVYYWDDSDIRAAGDWIARHLLPGGYLLLVHWTGTTDYPQTGDGAVCKLRSALGSIVNVVTACREAAYRLDLWCRPS